MGIAVAAIIPAIPMAVAFAFGIHKDGSPFRRSFWS